MLLRENLYKRLKNYLDSQPTERKTPLNTELLRYELKDNNLDDNNG